MLTVPHDSFARGHRVREFVCTYRTLRDDQGQTVRLPTLALSDPRIAAATLAPLLAGETVESFAVASLSTKHRLLAWHVLSRGTRSSTSISLPDVFLPACLTPGTTALLVVLEGASYQEAAGILGIPAGTLMSRLGRARATLRTMTGVTEEPRLRTVK